MFATTMLSDASISDGDGVRRPSAWPWLLAVGAVFGAVVFLNIGKLPLYASNELFTAERARETMLLGRWDAVYDNFEPSFNKPPLQYWLTAGALRWFSDPEFAARFWSSIFGVGCVVGSGWLAWTLGPRGMWAGLLAAAFTASSASMLNASLTGQLDAGFACFITLTLAAAQEARRDPRWWLAAGLFAGIGALQKLPLATAFLMILAMARAVATWRDQKTQTAWPWAGVAMALVLTAAWPLWQSIRFGDAFWETHVGKQIVGRFSFGADGPPDHPSWKYLEWFVRDWAAVAVAAIAACGWALLGRRWRMSPALRESAALAACYLGLLALLPDRAPRYGVPFIPLASAILAVVATEMLSARPARLLAAAACLIATALPLCYVEMQRNPSGATETRDLCRLLGANSREAQTIVAIQPAAARHMLRIQPMLFYGDLRQPVVTLKIEKELDQLRRLKRPVTGICLEPHWETLRSLAPDTVELARAGRYVLWRLDP